jgi:hypothetical protein
MARVEVVRMVADWLADPTNGVGAELATLPRDGTDPLPATPPVTSELDDPRVARNYNPETLPALAVTCEGMTFEPAITSNVRRFDAVMLVRYIEANTASDEVVRDSSYIMRAVRRAISRLMRTPAAQERNGVILGAINGGIAESAPFADQQDAPVTVGLTFTLSRCQDTNP